MNTRHTIFRRLGSITLSLCMLLSLLPPAIAADTTYQDGIYQGSAQGHHSTITMSVTIENGAISKVEEVAQDETEAFWNMASVLMQTIVAQQTADVDTISGATYSSDGIKNAVKQALEQATIVNSDIHDIATAEELAAISQDLSGNYRLTADIDLSNVTWTPIGTFVPRGSEGEEAEQPQSESAFSGVFDGNGHTISNLTVNQPDGYTVGLFGCTSGAEIKNLTVENVTVDGAKMVGGVIGYAFDSTVSNITLTGNNIITGHNSSNEEVGNADMVAGIVGAGMDSTVTSCHATANIIMPDNSSNAGIIGGGFEVASIINSTASGTITAGDDCYGFGGVSGCGFGSEQFTNCTAENVEIKMGKNAYLVGGVIGYAGGYENEEYGVQVTAISGCTAKNVAITLGDNFSAVNEIIGGGFYFEEVGKSYGAPYDQPSVYTLTNYVTENVTINGNTSTDPGSSDYTDGTYQGTAYGYLSDITVSVTIENGKIASVEEVTQAESPLFWNMAKAVMGKIVEEQTADVDAVSGATYSSTGIMNAVKKALERAANPNAEEVTEPQPSWFASGSGTQSDPFIIMTKEQLQQLGTSVTDIIDYTGYYVQLGANIDISGANWRPIGGSVYEFNGTFDGAGYTISGLTLGTDDKPYTLNSSLRAVGLFGIIGKEAVVKNLNMTNVQANVNSESQVRLGAIAGHANGDDSNHGGAIINNCTVQGGYLKNESEAGGNSFVGGIAGYLTGGAIINSMSNVTIESTTKYWYAEAGGISGINNAGLIANCYALGNVTGNDGGGVDTDVTASVLVGMQMGDLVNCYADGNVYANEASKYCGAVSGWVTDGRSYNSWYNSDTIMNLGGTQESAKAYGALDNATMDYDGLYYINNMVQELNAYNSSTKSTVADSLNHTFSAFPIDISVYGVGVNDLNTWAYENGQIVLTDNQATVSYVRPTAEYVEQVELPMQDGVWYGRDADKTTIVRITTSNNAVTNTEVLQGSSSGDAYNEALAKAQQKALYGDATNYDVVDTSSLRGSGTESDPYLISNEAELRLIAEAINEDQSWEGAYFKQTANIDVSSAEWLPIGWAIQGYYRSRWTQYCEYPFCGNYDGGDYTISGLHIGENNAPTNDTRMAYTAGFFGVTHGNVTSNYAISETENARLVTIKNVHLKDVSIYASSHSNNYAAGLIAEPSSGFIVDNCSVEGRIQAEAEVGTIYAGGLMGYALRGGIVTNTWTDVDITASTSRDSEGGYLYVGGMYGYDNRVTTINSYTLGDVFGDGKENSIYVGGFSGANGGAHYNTYAAGSVTANNTTNYIGGLDGWLPAIGADYHGYYNSDAAQIVSNQAVSTKKAVGVSSLAEERDRTEARTAAELGTTNFVDTLNANRTTISSEIPVMQEAIGYHPLHTVYYTGDGSDLRKWVQSGAYAVLSDELGGTDITTYTVTFNSNGGSTVASQSVTSGQTVSEPAVPTREGYTFAGWQLNGVLYDFSTPVTTNITLTAQWTSSGGTATTTTTYTVTFNSDGGSKVSSQKVKSGDKVTIPDNPTKTGYKFTAWYNNGSEWTFDTAVTENVTLTAQWQAVQGCYVATSVYGSYDCPEVWTLRRFRDEVLAKTWYGRLFIHFYYAISPTAVKLFGKTTLFQNFWRGKLDKMVDNLQAKGFDSTPYQDKDWN